MADGLTWWRMAADDSRLFDIVVDDGTRFDMNVDDNG